jgi:two-component system response regulator FlrC
MSERRVLVVDDDPEMRRALCEVVERTGHPVHGAVDGPSALARLSGESYALMISDMRMPGMTGLELLRRVRESQPDLPFVLVTAYGKVDEAVQAMKAGAFDFLQKPFRAEAIADVLRRAIAFETAAPAEPAAVVRANERPEEKALVTSDPKMRQILETLRSIAHSKATVLITGESGTGKEVLARFIHKTSSRKDRRFIAVNCAALPPGLLESELFGHEKGSFTGAVSQRLGRFEQADGGTLLLDEVTEIDLLLQAKLLRAIQEGEIDRVGGRAPVRVDTRLIATTNRDLGRAVAEGKFREDLYYRLNVFPVRIPPLRERAADIPHLVGHFVERHSHKNGCRVPVVSPEAMGMLAQHAWPGNVRELENCLERAVLLANGSAIAPEHLSLGGDFARASIGLRAALADAAAPGASNLRDQERRLILQTLRETHGNRTEASKRLGISIRTLRNKLREYRGAGLLTA